MLLQVSGLLVPQTDLWYGLAFSKEDRFKMSIEKQLLNNNIARMKIRRNPLFF